MARRPATTDEEVAKFRRDAERLLKTHLSGKIAEKLGVGSANFSSYVNGSKRPGKKILKKFYNLQEMQDAQDNSDNKKAKDYEHGGPTPSDLDETQGRFAVDLDDPGELRKELFRTYKMNNANCWAGLHEIIETNKIMANGHDETARGNTINARMMEKLLDKVLAIDANNDAK